MGKKLYDEKGRLVYEEREMERLLDTDTLSQLLRDYHYDINDNIMFEISDPTGMKKLYDKKGRLVYEEKEVRQHLGVDTLSSRLLRAEYHYDSSDNLIAEISDLTGITKYEYDDNNKLIRTIVNDKIIYYNMGG